MHRRVVVDASRGDGHHVRPSTIHLRLSDARLADRFPTVLPVEGRGGDQSPRSEGPRRGRRELHVHAAEELEQFARATRAGHRLPGHEPQDLRQPLRSCRSRSLARVGHVSAKILRGKRHAFSR